MENFFSFGFIYGLVAAGVIYFFLERIKKANNTRKQKYKPLDTFPDASQPNLTPAGIVRKSNVATISCVLWFIGLLVIIVLIFSFASSLLAYRDGFGLENQTYTTGYMFQTGMLFA